jgi:hypothetical protein
LRSGQNRWNSAFQVEMTSAGVASTPRSSTRMVFCHILPKPWTGPTTRRPVTFRLTASAGTWPSLRVVTFLAQ